MGQNYINEQPCMSVRCCCKLIEKREEKPVVATVTSKPRKNDCSGRPQISLGDFLKSQPILDWIKVNDMRQQHPRNEQCSMKPTSDERKGNSVPEDIQSSQIIINFGTVVTSGVCSKRDSSQQTDPEVKDVAVSVEKKQVCQTTTSSPVNRPTSVCPLPNQSTSTCPQTNRPTSNYPPANRQTSVCSPSNQSTSTCPQTNRPTSNCPPANLQTSTGLSTDRSTSTCPSPGQSTSTCSQTNRLTSNFPSANRSTSSNDPPINRLTSIGPQTNQPTSTCTPSPVNRPSSIDLPTNRPISSCSPANRSTSTSPATRPDFIVNKPTCGCNCHSKL
ncbi:salivary glue protein Sgs-3-like [Melanaphis sacchari]|uniref:salivary glue protein Sgs-3-like n=1 Tax=Melanaphis sacchari TaxID=742174 RepID=UPI000DC1303B|nr:salivary glue protein Sgs-3-like [Melanaphis sacchari]